MKMNIQALRHKKLFKLFILYMHIKDIDMMISWYYNQWSLSCLTEIKTWGFGNGTMLCAEYMKGLKSSAFCWRLTTLKWYTFEKRMCLLTEYKVGKYRKLLGLIISQTKLWCTKQITVSGKMSWIWNLSEPRIFTEFKAKVYNFSSFLKVLCSPVMDLQLFRVYHASCTVAAG